MKDSFNYSLTAQDYVDFETTKYRRAGTIKLLYVLAVIWIAIGIYDAVKTKNYIILIMSITFIVTTGAVYFYGRNIRPKKTANKFIGLDTSYLGEKRITVSDKDIEIKTLPRENEPMVIGVYPYSVMDSIMETDTFFQFILTTEAIILPKRVIPNELEENVTKAFRNNPNYFRIK